MSKLSIIQRRELEPLMLKADKIAKHYEKASNCAASVMGPDMESQLNNFDSICKSCPLARNEKECACLHIEAVNKARQLGGSYIYLCLKGYVFWTSPFYSGERFAGALLSGGVRKNDKNSDKVKALAQIMLLCADQISGMSFVQKNIVSKIKNKNLQMENNFNSSEFTQNMNIDKNSSQLKHQTNKAADCRNINKRADSQETGSTIDLERMLLASLRRGDNTEAQKILVKLLKILYLEFMDNIPVFKLKALELAVLLSRAVADPKDIKDNSALETTERCIKKIEESANFDEISEILSSITERMSGMIFSFHGVRHFSALRKAERFIWENYTRKLSLKEIAAASGLSAPYFSTVFKDEMGENLSNYLNRLRVEKAAAMLITTNEPIGEIAVNCGFEDQSWFSKIFKNNTGFTPGKYRELGIHAVA